MSAPEPKHLLDVGAAGAVIATLVGWLPTIAAVLAIFWYLIQIWESKTRRELWAWLRSRFA